MPIMLVAVPKAPPFHRASALPGSSKHVEFLVSSNRDSDLASVLPDLEANPTGLAVHDRTDVRDVNRHFLLDDAALRTLLRRLQVSLADINSADDDSVAFDIDRENLADFTLVVSRCDHYLITPLYVTCHVQTTSDASETIFM
jgi:hypothetical protein